MRPQTIGLARRARYLACVAAVGGLVAGAAVAAAPDAAPAAQAAQAAGTCQVTYAVQSDWGTGFTLGVTIQNTGPAITSWTLAYTYAGNQALSSGW
ncbi:MAG TPA: cellulose binding domain-containing protein, partial [Streptosporangiaceae bacterium]|nr:cellulose binding domain-containing protein [Streptosporangiaceae bacterium]